MQWEPKTELWTKLVPLLLSSQADTGSCVTMYGHVFITFTGLLPILWLGYRIETLEGIDFGVNAHPVTQNEQGAAWHHHCCWSDEQREKPARN